MGIIMTSNTTPAPYVVSASSQDGSPPTTEAWRAFDGSGSFGWLTQPDGLPAYIQFDWNIYGIKLQQYQVYCSPLNLFPARYPEAWIIEGSNDLATWHTLSTVSGQTHWNFIFNAGFAGTGDATTTGASATLLIVNYTVSADDVGRILTIEGGLSFITGSYRVAAVNVGANTWTLDRIASTGSASGLIAEFDRGSRIFTYSDRSTAYRYTRMTITGNNGDPDYVAITELDLSYGAGILNRVY